MRAQFATACARRSEERYAIDLACVPDRVLGLVLTQVLRRLSFAMALPAITSSSMPLCSALSMLFAALRPRIGTPTRLPRWGPRRDAAFGH